MVLFFPNLLHIHIYINHKVLPILNDAYYQLLFITFDQEDKETGYKGFYQFFEKLDSDMKEIDEYRTSMVLKN